LPFPSHRLSGGGQIQPNPGKSHQKHFSSGNCLGEHHMPCLLCLLCIPQPPTPGVCHRGLEKNEPAEKFFLMCNRNTVTHGTDKLALLMLPFTIKFQDGIPAAEQLLLAVRKAMLTGQLRAGDAFPSVRTLSQELRISPTTAHKVVLLLKADGLLAAQPGVGMVITAPAQATVSERQEQIGPACERLLNEAAELGLTLEQVITALRKTKIPARELLDAAEKARSR
jgi:GntR family transcriptional regulator